MSSVVMGGVSPQPTQKTPVQIDIGEGQESAIGSHFQARMLCAMRLVSDWECLLFAQTLTLAAPTGMLHLESHPEQGTTTAALCCASSCVAHTVCV